MNLEDLGALDLEEKDVIAFECAKLINSGEAIDTAPGRVTVAVTVYDGQDTSPGDLLDGNFQIVGTDVLVPVTGAGGVENVTYLVRVVIPLTGGRVLVLVGRITVERRGAPKA